MRLTSSERVMLWNCLIEYFSLNELKGLIFSLGIDYERFSHQNKEDLSREIIMYFEQREQLSCLITEIIKERPNISLLAEWLTKFGECADYSEQVAYFQRERLPPSSTSIEQEELTQQLICLLEVATGCVENLEVLTEFAKKTNWYDGNEKIFREKMAKSQQFTGYKLLQYYQANDMMLIRISDNTVKFPQEIITGEVQGIFENVFERFNPSSHFTEVTFQYPPAYSQFCTDMEKRRRNILSQSGVKLFDGANLRLSRLELVKGIGIEKIRTFHQPVYYFKAMGTNYSLDIPGKKGRTLRDLAHYEGKLEPLERSVMANPIGVNLLIVSSDDQIIIQHRHMTLAVRPGEACSSMSGTVDKDDALYLGYHPILRAVFREMLEEIALEKEDIGDVIFLGAVREFLRGGLADFFFAAKSNLTEEEIIDTARGSHRNVDQWEWEEIPDLSILPSSSVVPETETKRFEVFLRKYLDVLMDLKQPPSLPLLTNVLLLAKFQSRFPEVL